MKLDLKISYNQLISMALKIRSLAQKGTAVWLQMKVLDFLMI